MRGKLLLGAAALTAALFLRRRRFDLRGRVVFITGGARGLGLVLSRQLARRGCKLVICARDHETLETAHTELTALGAEVLAVPCDVRDPKSVREAIAAANATFGSIDVLINNAGAIEVGPLETMTDEDFAASMATHFFGPLSTMRMSGAKHIVNIASIGGLIALPHLAPYTASKFALVGLSSAMGAELAREGITVTTVCPGLMRTGSPRNARFKGRHREEYAWFSIGDALPFTAMRAERAARRICHAIERRERFVVIGLQARLAHLFAAIFPNLYAHSAEFANRLLPAPGGIGAEAARGYESTSPLSPSVLTAASERAAERNNELIYHRR
jgi:NAD(P)-dependent dehydrogenase (short-subunit alcohol dehydrogenase family)